MYGYTPKIAGEVFFGFKPEHTKGMTADQLYHRGVQFIRRMIAPLKLGEAVEFAILRPWVCAAVPKKARAVLDARSVSTAIELIDALQDHLLMDGDRTEGQAAIFRKQTHGSEGGGERKGSGANCFKCGKPGHKAFECWQGKGSSGGSGSFKPAVNPSSTPSKIICYTCGEEGHKSPQCTKVKKEKVTPKDGQPKPVRQLWHNRSSDTVLKGKVNGVEASVLLDSGASISVVPEVMVGPEHRTGEQVSVKSFQSKVPLTLPTAEVSFEIGSLSWVELVALAPVEEGCESKVLYGLNLKSERGLDLVLMANRLEQAEVLRVTTRSEAKETSQREEEEASIVAEEQPRVKPVSVEMMSSGESSGEGKPVADRPAGGPEPVASEQAIGNEKRRKDEILVEVEEVCDAETLADEQCAYVESDGEEKFDLRVQDRGQVELAIPPVMSGNASRAELVGETKVDSSLSAWRKLADSKEQGFSWQDGLLYQATTTYALDTAHLIVLPVKFRARVLELAHEKLGHLGARKVKALIKQRFVWPGVGQDVIDHCRSCVVCQRCSKAPARKVPLIEREILTEPFEVLAFDIVGLMPKGKGGCRFILTAICMASKWPEAVPLRSITARAVAQGMLEVFSRTGIPLQLLTDQGSQFVGSLVTHLCKALHIDKIKTTLYHPECNGVVERMHGTLGAMLTKASALGLDWVGQLPFAMFALRSAPNRDTQFSPFQLVYGHQVRTPLDILHQGWAEVSFKELDS